MTIKLGGSVCHFQTTRGTTCKPCCGMPLICRAPNAYLQSIDSPDGIIPFYDDDDDDDRDGGKKPGSQCSAHASQYVGPRVDRRDRHSFVAEIVCWGWVLSIVRAYVCQSSPMGLSLNIHEMEVLLSVAKRRLDIPFSIMNERAHLYMCDQDARRVSLKVH